MSSFYMAAAYGRRKEIAEYARQLESIGWTSVATWLGGENEDIDATVHTDEELAQLHAATDLLDVEFADVFILFTTPEGQEPSVRGGRHVEFGYALGMKRLFQFNKRIFIVGPIENIFHQLSRVEKVFPDFNAFQNFIAAEIIHNLHEIDRVDKQ